MTDPTDNANADLAAEAAAAVASAEPIDIGQPLEQPPADDAPKASAEDAAALGGLLKVTFNLGLAPRLGAHWALADNEASELGGAYAVVLNKYFPNWKTGPELAAIVTTFAVFAPRVAQTVAERQAAKKTDAPTEARTDVAGA